MKLLLSPFMNTCDGGRLLEQHVKLVVHLVEAVELLDEALND